MLIWHYLKGKTLNSQGHQIAVEFVAAVEASSGKAQSASFRDPMAPVDIIQGYNRLLTTERPDRGLDILARTGILQQTLPEVAALINFGDSIQHKDVWAHTKQVIVQSPRRLNLRWAALLHDIGKVSTRRFTSTGQVTFIGHPEVGARMFDRITQKYPFPNEARIEIRFLIASHLRAAAYLDTWSDSAVRRFTKETGPYLENLLDLSRADITSKYEEKVRKGLRQINFLVKRIVHIHEIDSKPKALPKGLGEELIREFKIIPGPNLGKLMSALTTAVETGRLPSQANFDIYVQFVRTHIDLLQLVSKPT